MAAAADRDELDAWLRLSLISGLGNASLRKLLLEFKSARNALNASHLALRHHVSADIASQIVDGGNALEAQRAWNWLSEPGNHVITLGEPDYPRPLLETPDPPPLLYLKGQREFLNRPAVAIVGSRNATAQGLNNAEDFARALSDAGLTIVSGLALGIDAAAHRGGLAGASSSIAIVGTGLDIVYPARNRDLAHELAARGALVSEFALGTPAIASNFPRRNRVISGIARGCLVVEAAVHSGSLITARFANEQGRDVYALPGSIHSPLARGCHSLIKQGAKLVDAVSDILEDLHLAPVAPTRDEPAVAGHSLLEVMGYEPLTLDRLHLLSGINPDALAAQLLELELQGCVEGLPGGRFQRIR